MNFQDAGQLAQTATNFCLGYPQICATIGGIAARVGTAAVALPVAASVMLLGMEGDNAPTATQMATNVADTGIEEEAQELMRQLRVKMCEALAILQSQTRDARRLQRIKATQKAYGWRRSSVQ
jgi:Bacterial toxin 34